MKTGKVVIITNQTKPHAKQTAAALKTVLDRAHVRQQWVETLPPQRNLYRRLAADQHGAGCQARRWLNSLGYFRLALARRSW